MAEPAIKLPEAKVYRLPRARIHAVISGYANAIFDAYVPPDVPPSDALHPEFWSHIVQEKGIQPGNFCYVRPDDRRWTLYVEVIDRGTNWLRARKLWLVEDESVVIDSGDLTKGFSVVWQGPINKYVVMRDSDKTLISKGHDKSGAQIAMIEHVRSIGA